MLEDEYRRHVLAHLKFLKYLDYRLVDEQAVSQAKEQYQDELLDMEEGEQQQAANQAAAEEKARREALHRKASMKGMDDLFEDLMTKGDGDLAKLKTQQVMQEPMTQLREQVEAAAEEYISLILTHQAAKDKEKSEFEGALEYAERRGIRRSQGRLPPTTPAKKLTDASNSEQPYAMIQTLHKANEALYEKLMDMEVSSSERYAESISAFESAYDELTKKTLEQLVVFCQKLRDIEAAYNERVVSAAGELLGKG